MSSILHGQGTDSACFALEHARLASLGVQRCCNTLRAKLTREKIDVDYHVEQDNRVEAIFTGDSVLGLHFWEWKVSFDAGLLVICLGRPRKLSSFFV